MGGFGGGGKAQPFQHTGHLLHPIHREVHDKGGGEAGHHPPPLGHGLLYPGQVGPDHLGVLGAGDDALAAEDALAADDLGLLAGKLDGLHRADPDALVAAFAVGPLET